MSEASNVPTAPATPRGHHRRAGWWPRRRRQAERSPGAAPDTGTAAAPEGGAHPSAHPPVLWRMRTTVPERPGALAALCAALAEAEVDILALQTHPLGESATVDEFMLRAPEALEKNRLVALAVAGGGRDTWLERADTHELVDVPTRVLAVATRTALDTAELPLALRAMLGRCTIRSVPAVSLSGKPMSDPVPPEGVLEETVLRLPDPSGGAIVVERPQLPFTPTEFARARALVELDAQLGQRVPRRRDLLTLPEGNPITVRRADTGDVEAAVAMHERCSEDTLRLRYHGPVRDADRYLAHLLSPRFGRTLAVETASGRLVALGHLLWDGDEAEVALLVEDDWQHRGIGGELLGRLVRMAVEAGYESVYAVTRSANTGMVATMRGLGLPLDYQIEEGTMVISAPLSPVAAPAGAEGR
ncbi:GNAT family N-acetyltransferase [Streptomyces sp. GSL17-111]|uniref:GNAT family N-acetyltransferase n=1 Tax=Streptomyces sp. GSL17-111 TaxID=3121596 RepID=UPI0030F3867B